jgi:hypothetical protein
MRHKGLTIDNVEMQRAVELYNHYAEPGGDEKCCFYASKTWSENFEEWTGLPKVKSVGKSPSAYYMAGTNYPLHFNNIIEEKNCL